MSTPLVVRRPLVMAVCALAAHLVWSSPASAYSFETLVSDGCHERITMDALRGVRSVRGLEWREPQADDAALLDDLPFHVDADLRDFGAATLLVSNREVDLGGRNPTDAFELAELHGDPRVQVAHCLRMPEDDGAAGGEAALARCRAYVLNEFRAALRSRTMELKPTRDVKVSLTTALGTRGITRVSVPRYYFHLGRALHALQDSFTHTLRTEDAKKVLTVVNWIDGLSAAYDQDRDGPDHKSSLDECADTTKRSHARRLLATEATARLLSAAQKPESEALVEAETIVGDYMGSSTSCTDTVDYCGAIADAASLSACSAGAALTSTQACTFGISVLALLGLRARRRRRPVAIALVGLSLLFGGSRSAEAQELRASNLAAGAAPRSPWGAAGSFSASLDRPALALTLGPRFRASEHWLFGLDSEWNPWISVQDTRLRSGVFNQSFVSILRYDLGPVALRMTVRGGISVLLYDLYGAQAGSVGPLLGVNLLGVDVPLGKDFKLIIDPADFMVAVPSLRGAPLIHRQYRIAVGIQWGS